MKTLKDKKLPSIVHFGILVLDLRVLKEVKTLRIQGDPGRPSGENRSMRTYRLVFVNKTGALQQKDFEDVAELAKQYEQLGVEEDSYTIRLHVEPVFRGLIGPLSEGKSVIRYETPEAFASLTEEWSKTIRTGRKILD